MSAVTLVFPHQLFEENPALQPGRPVVLVEEHLFFKQYNFHKLKLVFHRAGMKAYAAWLKTHGYEVIYMESIGKEAEITDLIRYLKDQGMDEIHYVDGTDFWLEKRLTKSAARFLVTLKKYNSPLFLLSTSQIESYFKSRKRFYQADFYSYQRKQFKILVDDQLQPIGGKWSFDAENRLKYPKGKKTPDVVFPHANEFWDEAVVYIEKHFATNCGSVSATFIYPTTFAESRSWLTQFLGNRFREFGDFEDSLVVKEHILHHSVLTPMLNVGLLTPGEILEQAILFANSESIPLNSLEGFVRQILGWREFIRGVYESRGVMQRTTNRWGFKRKIPKSFWNGTTGIAPVDTTIRKVLETGYCHHIERLMVLGNFMLLCEFDPDEVYHWFMQLFIDAYDWAMVPNVYGMSQFADGGLMATKPYISGSNYLMKMSDYPKGDWQPVWDGLFWRFMDKHREFFLKNPRLGMLVTSFDKMPEEKRQQHLSLASRYLSTLDTRAD